MHALRLIALGIAAASLAGEPRQVREQPPNILLVIADDWSHPHAGVYGDRTLSTPAFDRVAREGALFANAFTAAPSCTPSRAALLTGQAIHRLEDSGNLWSTLSSKIPVYPDLLEAQGYAVGLRGKGMPLSLVTTTIVFAARPDASSVLRSSATSRSKRWISR